ncbi:MAG: hypothetical protein R3C18_14300 [Planctomycetaceae bacterium]
MTKHIPLNSANTKAWMSWLAVVAFAVIACLWIHDYLQSLPLHTHLTETVDEDAIDMVDQSELNPLIAEFISSMRRHEVCGHPAKEFVDVLELADITEEADRRRSRVWYTFLLPMTEQHLALSREAATTQVHVVCWPKLMVSVDPDSGMVYQARVIRQCL